jgi:Pyruvate/2-oxoacid:ferredoxin oxidoreductase delta subunit
LTVADFDNSILTTFTEARFHGVFPLATGVLESDGIISLPKMKTHGLSRITGAVKNQFGCIVGFDKAKFHLKYSNAQKFCSLLVDLNLFLKPRLFIMDGIMAMEGEGPSGGDPVPMKVLLFSTDSVALDTAFCRMIDLNPSFVPTNVLGESFGLGTMREDNTEYRGDDIALFHNPAYRVKRIPVEEDITFRVLRPIRNQLVPRPVIESKSCLRCGICVEACPVVGKALDFTDSSKKNPPRYDYTACIRCYCCQEMCPHKAISIKTPLLGRILSRLLPTGKG